MRRKLGSLVALTGVSILPALCQQEVKNPFAGRWDLTVKTPTESYPAWMEVEGATGGLRVRVVGKLTSAHSAENVRQDDSKISFTSSERFGGPTKVSWEMTVNGSKLTGAQKREDGVTGQIIGVRAPALPRMTPAVWSDPEPLFTGKDLNGWVPDKPAENHWRAINGVLVNEAPGANIRTKRRFKDFKLHVEYNCPKDGNSGVYLRGRYEIQIEYESPGKHDKLHSMGAIHGFIAPSAEVSPRPGQWETLDITLVGRTVSILRDGELIINREQIPGITGGALDSHEGEPGPICLQGDHTGGMKYRNITISVPKG